MCRVLLDPTVAGLNIAKLALEPPKRIRDLGPDTGLELFQFVTKVVAEFVFVLRFDLALHHGLKWTPESRQS